MSTQNDPRAEVFAALEGIEGGEALRDSLKAFTDSLVDKQINTNNELKASVAKVEELSNQEPIVKEVIVEHGKDEIAELTQKLNAMQETLAQKDKRANELVIRDAFLKETGLRDAVARDKIDLAIMREEVAVIDGKPVGVIGDTHIAFSDYVQSVNEANATELRVKAGGKSEGFAGGGETIAPVTSAQAVESAIEQAGGSMPTIR